MAAEYHVLRNSNILKQHLSDEYHVSDDSKIVAEHLLAADIKIPQLLCFAVQAAAFNVVGEVNKPFIGKGICVRPIYSHSIDRTTRCQTLDEEGTVAYYPDDLMVIGGMAIALYDYSISDIKEIRQLPSLKNSLTKNTSDIDMVWWPRSSLVDSVITINSPGIHVLCDEFIRKIKHEMDTTFRKHELSKNSTKEQRIHAETASKVVDLIVGNIPGAASFTTNVFIKSMIPNFGAIHICINFIITYENGETIELEMCDIAIHDSGSSQQTPARRLELMIVDPVYCNPHNEIKKLLVNPPLHINVPIIQKLVSQQLLSFENLLKDYYTDELRRSNAILEKIKNKCMINYNRLRYIQFILAQTQMANAPKNAYNPIFFYEFGISQQDVSRIIVYIDIELHRIISEKCGIHKEKLCNALYAEQKKFIMTYRAQHEELRKQMEQQQLIQQQYWIQYYRAQQQAHQQWVQSQSHPSRRQRGKQKQQSQAQLQPSQSHPSREKPPIPPKKGGRQTRRTKRKLRSTTKRH